MTIVTTTITHAVGKPAIDALNDPVAASKIYNFFSHLGLRFKFSSSKKITSRKMSYNADGTVMTTQIVFTDAATATEYTGHSVIVGMIEALKAAGYSVSITTQD